MKNRDNKKENVGMGECENAGVGSTGSSRRHKTKKTTGIVLAVIAIAVVTGAVAGVVGLRQPTANGAEVRVDVPEGTPYPALCDSLEARGVLRGRTAFGLMARALGLDRGVRAGSYVVRPHTRMLTLVRKLRNGQQDPMRLTIGKFRLPGQLNEYLNSKLMHDDFDFGLDNFHTVLPDTYEVYWTVSPKQLEERMLKEYERYRKGKDFKEMQGVRDFRDVVILASIVEEETNYGPEKPLIASVYLNRLRIGMPLQADPTVKYAVGDFGLRRILNRHLAEESPFNTYLHAGLPPAPICLPSKATIEAVLKAPETKYLYFCASPELNGTHRFAATLGEHNRNAAEYHRAILGIEN